MLFRYPRKEKLIMKIKDGLYSFNKITQSFEIVMAVILLIIIVIKTIDMVFELIGLETVILTMDFQRILSISFSLIIGVEFVNMLHRHTPEAIIEVLLFALARQIILSNESSMDMIIGVVAISGLFATKRFLIDPLKK